MSGSAAVSTVVPPQLLRIVGSAGLKRCVGRNVFFVPILGEATVIRPRTDSGTHIPLTANSGGVRETMDTATVASALHTGHAQHVDVAAAATMTSAIHEPPHSSATVSTARSTVTHSTRDDQALGTQPHDHEIMFKSETLGGRVPHALFRQLKREIRAGDVLDVTVGHIEPRAARNGVSPLYHAVTAQCLVMRVQSNTGIVRHVESGRHASATHTDEEASDGVRHGVAATDAAAADAACDKPVVPHRDLLAADKPPCDLVEKGDEKQADGAGDDTETMDGWFGEDWDDLAHDGECTDDVVDVDGGTRLTPTKNAHSQAHASTVDTGCRDASTGHVTTPPPLSHCTQHTERSSLEHTRQVTTQHCSDRAKVFGDWLIDTFDLHRRLGCTDNLSGTADIDGTTTREPWSSHSDTDHERHSDNNGGREGAAVLDVAGGKGELSLMLTLANIRSIVVDPREGKLSRRQRKALRRSKLESFQCVHAMFGGHDADALTATAQLIHTTRAAVIVGLHPDEATDAIVDTAVAHRLPFAVVPCCVYSRLFPDRRVRGDPVSTWSQLCEYLLNKHPAVQATRLPFPGQNLAIYCTDYSLEKSDTTMKVMATLQTATDEFIKPVHAERLTVHAH
eukprot:m.14343 g.14343  ORF g.14343 m.14343 type:complete len:623 (+) comp3144_c0_seq2:72-1940(+)